MKLVVSMRLYSSRMSEFTNNNFQLTVNTVHKFMLCMYVTAQTHLHVVFGVVKCSPPENNRIRDESGKSDLLQDGNRNN